MVVFLGASNNKSQNNYRYDNEKEAQTAERELEPFPGNGDVYVIDNGHTYSYYVNIGNETFIKDFVNIDDTQIIEENKRKPKIVERTSTNEKQYVLYVPTGSIVRK